MKASATTEAQESLRLSDILARHETELLSQWIDEQMSASTLRRDLMKESELREQSEQFLSLLRQATRSENLKDTTRPEWEGVREFLIDLSGSRAAQGFTPSETATFIFSLRAPLTELLQRADAPPASVRAATVLLDKLGLFTFEGYQKSREAVISRQQQEMLELSTPVVRLFEGIVALPLIGTLDSARTQVVMENLLERIVETGAEIAIIDITGVPTVDTLVAQHLLKASPPRA